MDADGFLQKEDTFRVIGAAMAVLNAVGHGLHEKPYENGLVVEFRHSGIRYAQQRRFPVLYRGEIIAEFIPDLIALDSIVVDTKVIERITNHERGQMLNYLRITGLKIGLILNFKRAKLEWERVILSS